MKTTTTSAILGLLLLSLPGALRAQECLSDPLRYCWPVGSDPNEQQQLNGTFMEFRSGPPQHLHRGIDVQGTWGSAVYPVTNSMTVLEVINPGTSNESVRLRDDATWWEFTLRHLEGTTVYVGQSVGWDPDPPPYGTWDVIGYTNSQNHVHLEDGDEYYEYNPLDPTFGIEPFSDSYAPSILNCGGNCGNGFFRMETDGTDIELDMSGGFYQVRGKVDVIVKANDGVSTYGGYNLGVYGVEYEVRDSSGFVVANNSYTFEQAWGATMNPAYVYSLLLSNTSNFWYTPTNDLSANGYWDSELVDDGWYDVCITVRDRSGNDDWTCDAVEVVNTVTGINDAFWITGPEELEQGQWVTYDGTFWDADQTGTTDGDWSWELSAYRGDGSLELLESTVTPGCGYVYCERQWSFEVPQLAGDWLVFQGRVPGVVRAEMTDSDLYTHVDEIEVWIDAPNLAVCGEPGPGLRAWYPFDETGGAVAADVVGGNDGAHVNGPTPVPGVSGNALSFDGVDDYVEVADEAMLDLGTGDFSVLFWITTTQASGVRVIQDKRVLPQAEGGEEKATPPPGGYHVHLYQGRVAIQLADASGYTNYNTDAFVADGEPHLVALAIDRDGAGWVYLDGILVDTFDPGARSGSLDNDAPLRLGRRSYGSPGSFAGTLDDFQIYDRILSASDVDRIWTAGPAGQCPCIQPPAGLAAWYPFDEQSGTVANDLVHGNDGSHFGGPQPVPGTRGWALGFDGVDDYVEVDDNEAVAVGTADFSMAFWVTTTQTSSTRSIQDKRVWPDHGYHVYLQSGKVGVQLAEGGSFSNFLSPTFIADGDPHFVAVTVDRDGLGRIFIDGVEDRTFNPGSKQGSLDNGGPLRFGRRSAGTPGYFGGTLDELQIVRGLMTPAEVRGSYHLGQCKPAVTPPAPPTASLSACTLCYPPRTYCVTGSASGGELPLTPWWRWAGGAWYADGPQGAGPWPEQFTNAEPFLVEFKVVDAAGQESDVVSRFCSDF